MKHVRSFLFILGAALVSSALGGIFGALVAVISPEFVEGFLSPASGSLVRYAAVLGMIWGIFIGAAAMGFCLFISAIANWFRPKSQGQGAGQETGTGA